MLSRYNNGIDPTTFDEQSDRKFTQLAVDVLYRFGALHLASAAHRHLEDAGCRFARNWLPVRLQVFGNPDRADGRSDVGGSTDIPTTDGDLLWKQNVERRATWTAVARLLGNNCRTGAVCVDCYLELLQLSLRDVRHAGRTSS